MCHQHVRFVGFGICVVGFYMIGVQSISTSSPHSSSSSSEISNLAFLELDPWEIEIPNDRNNHLESGSIDLNSIVLDRMAMVPPLTWKLPDFHQELDMLVHVTRGASSESPSSLSNILPTPLFTPDECHAVIQAAESHFEGSSWTTLPSGDYQVAGYVVLFDHFDIHYHLPSVRY
jgi:hypothetical protein